MSRVAPCWRSLRIAWPVLAIGTAVTPAGAASPLPAPDGVYCGPGDATITIDSGHNIARIAGYTCGYPIIAADELQSSQCWKPGESPDRKEFDVRLLDRTLYYNQIPYTWCRPLPPG